INRMGEQTGIFFRGDERQYLNGLTRYLDSTRRASRAGAVTPTGQEILQVGIPAGVATDFIGTGGIGTAAFGSYGALARVYESPKVRNFMLRLASTPKGSTAGDRLMEQIRVAIEPILQGERAEVMNR
ncbi:MAG: lytic transglycosylase domain-containing protein, partial [Providencia sp.]